MFNNFINVTLFSFQKLYFLLLGTYDIFLFLCPLLEFLCLKCIFFYFYIFLWLVPVFLSFPFFLDFFLLLLKFTLPSLFTFNPLLVFLFRFLLALCSDSLFFSGKTNLISVYAFPFDSPRIIPVAIRWATLRGSGILLLIEVRWIIFSVLFAPIPAFWT